MRAFLWTALLLSGCMVGPKYREPEMQLPAQFDESQSSETSQADLRDWWKQFNDPVLDSLIEEAISCNYDLRIAIEKIEQARAQFRIEKSYLWPEIDLNAMASRSRISQNLFPRPDQAPTAGTGIFPTFLNIFQVGFDAVWELDFFGKFRHEKRAAYFSWEATKDDAKSVLISMLSEVAVTYVNIRALQKKIDLAKRKIEADEEELAIAEDLYLIGLDNEIQVSTLISTLQTDLAALSPLEASLKQTVYALAYLLGRPPEGLMERFQEPSPIPSSFGKIPVGLPSDLLRRRPDVRSAERQLAAATEHVGSAIADLFPHVALTGISFGGANKLGSFAGYESSRFSKLLESASRMFSVGLGFNWNLLDFGRVRGEIKVKNSLQKQALLTYEQTVIGSLKDVESALAAYYEEQNRQGAFVQKVDANGRTYEITKSLYDIGLANENDLLNAKRMLIDSESSLADSEQSLAGDLIAVYKALGGDWHPN